MSPSVTIDMSNRRAETGPLCRISIQSSTIDTVRIQLSGELDYSNTELLSAWLRSQIGHRIVRLDLAAVTFVDCAVVGTVLAAHEQQQARAAELQLVNVGRPVRRVLELTRADQILQIVDDPEGDRPCSDAAP